MKALSPGNKKRGFATLEILIAFTILILSMTAVIVVAFSNQSVSIDTQTSSEALARAGAQLEATRAAALQNFASVAPHAGVVEQSGPISYTKTLDVADLTSYSKQATSTVSWYSAGRLLSVVLSTILTDPTSALTGDTCSDTLSGDWTKPQDWKGGFGYADIVSPSGASGVDAFNKKVYLTSDVANKDNFYIIDVSNPKPAGLNLPILGSLQFTYGLTDVRVVGNYAYASVDNTATVQLVVIDISNPAAPAVAAQIDVTAPGDTAYGNTLSYYNGKIYLGLTKSTGKELRIIDIADPLHPAEVGSLETNTAINQIVVKDNIAYLATPSTDQLWKVDVSDPSAPSVLQTFKPAGASNWSGQTVALSKSTPEVFLGRMYNVGGNNKDLYALNSADLSQAGSLTQTKQDGFTRMVVRDNLLFASTAKSNDGFQIWDVSNPSNMTRYDTTSLNIQQASTAGMDCDGNYIYIGQRSNRALQIVGPS